jgi:hypothetical protein
MRTIYIVSYVPSAFALVSQHEKGRHLKARAFHTEREADAFVLQLFRSADWRLVESRRVEVNNGQFVTTDPPF